MNKQDEHGLLPLHHACETGNFDAVSILIQNSEGSLSSGSSARNIVEFMADLAQPLTPGQNKFVKIIQIPLSKSLDVSS